MKLFGFGSRAAAYYNILKEEKLCNNITRLKCNMPRIILLYLMLCNLFELEVMSHFEPALDTKVQFTILLLKPNKEIVMLIRSISKRSIGNVHKHADTYN